MSRQLWMGIMVLHIVVIFVNWDKLCLSVVAILVRMTLSTKIELIHFSNLSSRDPNCQDNIQLFLQQFEKFIVYCVTNWHYKVLGTKQTSEWYFTCLRSQSDNLLFNCNSVYELCVKYCPRTISPYSLQYILFSHVLQSIQMFVYKPVYFPCNLTSSLYSNVITSTKINSTSVHTYICVCFIKKRIQYSTSVSADD